MIALLQKKLQEILQHVQCGAIFTHEGSRHVMLIDAWDEHLSYPDLREKAIKGWGKEYGGMTKESPYSRAKRPDRILIEAKASGQSLLQDLRLAKGSGHRI